MKYLIMIMICLTVIGCSNNKEYELDNSELRYCNSDYSYDLDYSERK